MKETPYLCILAIRDAPAGSRPLPVPPTDKTKRNQIKVDTNT